MAKICLLLSVATNDRCCKCRGAHPLEGKEALISMPLLAQRIENGDRYRYADRETSNKSNESNHVESVVPAIILLLYDAQQEDHDWDSSTKTLSHYRIHTR